MLQSEIKFRIILLKPPSNVDFALQKGTGNNYETVQKQRSKGDDLHFNFFIKIKGDKQKESSPKFSGDFVHGPADGKFIYIDIGTYAGQIDSIWSRRLKVPLNGISWNDIDELSTDANLVLETRVPGTGKDGGPTCATVKPFDGWHLKAL